MDRYEAGLKIMRRHLGPRADEYVETLHQISPLFAKVNVEFAFGDLYGQKSYLDDRTRELATIAALTVQGFSIPQLNIHIRAALRCGVSQEEIIDIITQMIAYGGFPAATNAILEAKKVFESLD